VTVFIHTLPAWFELIFLAICTGALVCCLWVLDASAGAGFPSQEKILARLWRSFGIGIAAIIACTIAALLIGTAEMSGSPIPAVFPLLPTVILKTHFGRVWLIRMASLILLSVVVSTGRRYRDARTFLYLLLGAGVIIAFTESASGHAADAGDFSLAEIMDWLHVLAASVWGGGLFALSFSILPKLIKPGEGTAALVAGAARRFSTIAGFAVGIIALTALYNAWLYVGSFEALWKTPYGWTVIAKTFLFFLLITLGAFNRYVSVPLLQEWAGTPPAKHGIIGGIAARFCSRFPRNQEGYRTAVRFMNAVKAEAFLMAAVLLCAALLRHEVPARHALHIEHAGSVGGQAGPNHAAHLHHAAARPESVVVRLETDPAKINAGSPVSITVHLEDRKGRPLQGLTAYHERVLHAVIIGQDLNVFAHIHPEDLGMLTDEMLDTATFPLRFTFPKAGIYLVGIDFATEDGIYTKTATLFVAGKPGMGEPKIDFSRSKNFGHYRVTFTTSPQRIKAGEETTLKYLIEKDGKPVKDLQPYLGAPMHLAVVRSDLSQFIHTHGVLSGESNDHDDHVHAMLPERFGPKIEAAIIFPAKGAYKIFSQVEHRGKVLPFDFLVEVR
jgi:putative copper resistance protein D